MASKSTYSPEAQHHQSALKTSTADFIKLMKDEDEHNVKHYGSYIPNIKFLLDTHIADLVTHEPKDVEKQIIETVKDLTCKYLHWQESETESSNEDFPEILQDLSKNKSSVNSPKELWPMRWRRTLKMLLCLWNNCTQLLPMPWRSSSRPPLSSLVVHSDFCYRPCVNWSLNSEVTTSGKSREKHLKVTPSYAFYQAQQQVWTYLHLSRLQLQPSCTSWKLNFASIHPSTTQLKYSMCQRKS